MALVLATAPSIAGAALEAATELGGIYQDLGYGAITSQALLRATCGWRVSERADSRAST